MDYLIFFDIDGTLAYPQQDPSPVTIEAIAKARRQGHKAFISTGRTPDSIPAGIKAIEFDGGIYSAGGVCILGDTVVSHHFMSEQVLKGILEILISEPVFFELETTDGRFHSENGALILSQADLANASVEMQELVSSLLLETDARPISEYRGQGVHKIAYYCAHQEVAQQLSAALNGIATVVAFNNLPGLPLAIGEISDPHISKAIALMDICQQLGKTPAECIAFGDSMNDMDILKTAGLGIAMGNADPQLITIADRVCDCCENDGVAKMLCDLNLF